MSDYCLVKDGKIVSGPFARERIALRAMSVSERTTDEELAKHDILPFELVSPSFDPATQTRSEYTDEVQKGKVVRSYTVTDKTPAELDAEDAAQATAFADSDIALLARAIAQVQEQKGSHMTTADLPALRNRLIALAKRR